MFIFREFCGWTLKKKKKNFLINKIIVRLLLKLYHILKHYDNWTVLKRKIDCNVLCVKNFFISITKFSFICLYMSCSQLCNFILFIYFFFGCGLLQFANMHDNCIQRCCLFDSVWLDIIEERRVFLKYLPTNHQLWPSKKEGGKNEKWHAPL